MSRSYKKKVRDRGKEATAAGLHVAFLPWQIWYGIPDGESGGIFRRGSVSQFLFCESPGGRLPGSDMKATEKSVPLPGTLQVMAEQRQADYNTVSIDSHTFQEFYLKGYQAGIDAEAGMVIMTF